MIAFERYINSLVNGDEPDDDFPKNESSWEELYEFGKRRVSEIVELHKKVAQLETAIRNHFGVVQIPKSSLLPTEKTLLDLVKE